MRISVAQINASLGSFEDNAKKINEYILKSRERHCDLVLFPESIIFGYHPFDLLERDQLVDDQLAQIESIQKQTPSGMAVLLGVITKNKSKKGKPYFNSAVLIQKGKKPIYFHKQLLPTGDVFDEARFIENGSLEKNFFLFKKKRVFVTICEDIWAWPDENGKSQWKNNPLETIKTKKIDLIVNLSASPFYPNKIKRRQSLVKKTAKKFNAPMVYCNLVGAQDEIIFDGGSFAVNAKGKILMQSQMFEEEMNVLDLNKMVGGVRPMIEDSSEEIRRALVLGIRDFCEKTGLEHVHLGLSGGVDSALVACLAVDAMGPGAVTGFALPTQFNSPESLELAERIAKNLNIHFQKNSVQELFDFFRAHIDKSLGVKEFGLVHENLQARIRGMFLMAHANLRGSLLLTTSNKSEYAAGYSTLYGDMCGGLAPIGDLTKTQVYELCALYNRHIEIIPEKILTRAPSAELRPNQKDQDTLPPYADLDESVVRIIERGERLKTKTDKWLFSALLKSEFKRWQAPPILRVSAHSFGRGRRWPISQEITKIG
jgi:NAD+ synthase (glutamine-hydrolysing)